MKKLVLILLITFSFSYGETVGEASGKLSDKLIDCFNENHQLGYAVFGNINVLKMDSIGIIGNYISDKCPRANWELNRIQREWTDRNREIIVSYALADVLHAMSNKLREKANDFIEYGNTR